jgi:hypothetical protein
MYRPPNARAAMMIKTVNMARSFDEPEGHEPSAGVSRVPPQPTLEIGN